MGGSWPKPPDNPAATAHAADSFSDWEAGRSAGTESAVALISRMRIIDPTKLHRRDLRRTIHPGWALLDREDDGNLAWLLRLLDAAIALGRRPMDRAVIATWLDVFPEGPGSAQLAAAAAMAANRHDWPYAPAGQRFSLWERVSGAAALGREILANADTDALRYVQQCGASSFGSCSGSVCNIYCRSFQTSNNNAGCVVTWSKRSAF